MTYYCSLAPNGVCPCGVNANAKDENWPFPVCLGTGRKSTSPGSIPRTYSCRYYAKAYDEGKLWDDVPRYKNPPL